MPLKRKHTITFKLSMIVFNFLIIVLICCGLLTYFNQMSSYRKQCETDLKAMGEYLGKQMEADGEDFIRYQTYFLEHYTDVDIPIDADDYIPYLRNYERLFHTTYPGKVLGDDIQFDELSDDVKKAYLEYRQVYWLQMFQEAKDTFNLAYSYYILPDSETESDIYILDGTRASRADHIEVMKENPFYAKFDHPQGDEAEYLYLGDQVSNERKDYPTKWAVWDSGETQKGFQVWDNDYGKTYACYTPIVINGKKMGLIGTEIEIATVNTAILHNTIRQFALIGLVLLIGILILMWLINRRYINRIIALESNVRAYSDAKDSSLAEKMRKDIRGNDELGFLSECIAQMIEETDKYITRLMTVHRKLDTANTNVSKMSELALKDGLTGIRNQTAFSQETKKIDEKIAKGDAKFAIALIDLNELKNINDEYGHDKGNEAIISLSRFICGTFKHSMVFRVGGDEFVAVLLNEDYENRENLIRNARNTLNKIKSDKTLPTWKKNGAAIGLATYDPKQDKSIHDVTRRADANMYEQKNIIKGN